MRQLTELYGLVGRLLSKAQGQPSIVLAYVAGFLANLRESAMHCCIDDFVDDGDGVVGQVELDEIFGGGDGFVDHGNGGVFHRVENVGLEMADQTDDGVPESPAQADQIGVDGGCGD